MGRFEEAEEEGRRGKEEGWEEEEALKNGKGKRDGEGEREENKYINREVYSSINIHKL